jgi:hypothetical protein
MEPFLRLDMNSRLLASPSNIRLGGKLVGMANSNNLGSKKFNDAKHQGPSLVAELLLCRKQLERLPYICS